MNKLLLKTRFKRGFTLIEVMLAMAVFAIAGVALVGVADNNARHVAYLEEKMFAGWVASNQLVSAHLSTAWPPKNNLKGEVEMAGRKWFWLQKVIKTDNNEMRAIVMEVRLDVDDESALSSVMTYIAQDAP
ncbi:type II secretion system minor pseudopilin GspI [Colwellia sp. D2M02]|uniref:Type II secretion system protein I n=1 Tax=Colwellia asteriadis TaxID=517723 RepID=A0ABN1L3B4_9GAMM|nr:type II secretion system minor pseudopilin GspI [Colwellia sp. D2M02]MBU2891745.1 type II secretion system minor pseudopilin GspI [Colwellia sp. D2M02]